MAAGTLDRRITIERAVMTTNGFNERVPTWLPLATVWAHRRDASAGEAYRAQEVGAQLTTRFTIRYSSTVSDVNPKDRISYDGRVYNITAVREPEGTRREWIEIDAVARSDAA
ncbi:phage head closure protein [Filomicrobium sp.]|uniref:phage head closure protein n=1 Tax=Filomicrobium sp. TaxID=2024831 RepID=UPI002585DA60|nr:phage head closure protein [Filomicrobium sp.]MCV0371077.1 phage head closure protein [Filomicrobium sp.]